MDYDNWLRLLNTIANYSTAILVMVLVMRDTRERTARRKGGRALREAVERVRTERKQPDTEHRLAEKLKHDRGVASDLIMGDRCEGNACSKHHTYAEGCQLAHLVPGKNPYTAEDRAERKAALFRDLYDWQQPGYSGPKLTEDQKREIIERRGTFTERAEALGWGSQGRRPSSLRHPVQSPGVQPADDPGVDIPEPRDHGVQSEDLGTFTTE